MLTSVMILILGEPLNIMTLGGFAPCVGILLMSDRND